MNPLRWLPLALILTGCAESALAPSEKPLSVDFSPGHRAYGVKGTLNQSQLEQIQTLSWPQAYEDMKTSYGFPAHRTETADYYHLEGTTQWVVIQYAGAQATGYRIEY